MGKKYSIIKDKIAKAKRYDWRREKEKMLGISDKEHNNRMKYFLSLKDQELLREEAEDNRRGWCPLCGSPLTEPGSCQVCEYIRPKKLFTETEWFIKGCIYQVLKVNRMINDYST